MLRVGRGVKEVLVKETYERLGKLERW